MQKIVWKIMAVGSAALASMAVRQLLSAAWPGETPRNPADRSTSRSSALVWAGLSGVAAGAARMLAQRGSTVAFEKMFDESPPGVQTA